MAISPLNIPYPDFKFDDIINPEAFDLNNETIKTKVNETITDVNNSVKKEWSGWTVLPLWTGSNWREYTGGGIWSKPRYHKDDHGWVTLKGLVEGGLANSWICLLPEGHRPSETMSFPVCHNSGVSRVQIGIDGSCTIIGTYDSFVFLDGIRFNVNVD